MKTNKLWKKVLSLGLCAAMLAGGAGALIGDEISVAGETSEYVNFEADLFDYNQYPMNTASQAEKSNYLSIGTAGESWNACNYDGVYQGLAGSTLEGGMITFPNYGAADFFTSDGRDNTKTSFYTTTENTKTSYYNVTFPFEKQGDSYVYDSSKQSATLNTQTGAVTIGNANGGFWPFGVNSYYFGMNFKTDFYMTKDGKINGEDIVFEFSGDDDVWVYIDGQLLLDLGGIHGAVAGSINFSTGEVKFYNEDLDPSQKGVIKASTLASYIENTTVKKVDWKDQITEASYNFYNSSANSLSKANLLDGDSHELQVYYMERGAGKSNCKIEFNLPQTPQQNTLKVTNTVENTIQGEKVEDNTAFTYIVNKNDEAVANAAYTWKSANGSTESRTTTAEGTFTLQDGESALFEEPAEGTYTVTEVLEDGYSASYTAEKNETQTSVGGPVTKSDSATTLVASHIIKTEMNQDNDFYQIDFLNTKSLDELTFDSNKTATLTNWDERTYDIELSASSTTSYTTGGDTIVTETKPAVDVILVLDMSESMRGTPTTDLKNAATGFVTNLSQNAAAGSQVAVVKYNKNAEVIQSLTTLTEDSAATINSNINSMSNSSGTNTGNGMGEAKKILANCKNPNKYVILFTDGQPNPTNCAVTAYNYAVEMKQSATVYTVRLGNISGGRLTYGSYKNRSYEQWLVDMATDEAHALSTSTSSQLNTIFEAIQSEITSEVTTTAVALNNATVVDTIDARFELTSGEKERLINEGAKVEVNNDGTTTITWENQTLEAATVTDGVATAGWSKVIHVKAKDNYLGGNNVATNVNPGSYIQVGKEKVEFEQPKVNVKVDFELKDDSTKIFLGETLEAYFTEQTVEGMLNTLSQMETYGDSTIETIWSDENGSKVTEEQIKAASPEEQTKYTLKVTVTPKYTSGSAEAAAAAESMKANPDDATYTVAVVEKSKTYTVNVVTGSITITKKINQASYNAKDGDPIFTYKVTNLLDHTVYYRTVRFNVNEKEATTTTDYYVRSAQITDLPQGLYRVEELDTMGFTLESVGTDEDHTSASYADENDSAVYAIGFDLADKKTVSDVLSTDDYNGLISGPEDKHLERKDAKVIFVNQKVRTPGKETDTDVVKNSLVIGETYSGNSNADNQQ